MTRPDLDIQHNLLTNVQFKFEVHNIPHVVFHSQSVIVPSMQIDQPMMNSPRRDVPLPGSKLNFDPFNLEFVVDSDLKNYKEIADWMIRLVTVEPVMKEMSDATLHIMNADLTPKSIIKFFNCHPNMLSELPFSSTTPDSEPLIATTMFSFSHFEVEGSPEI